MRYFIKLSYNGANYHGWQRQPSASSVQQTLEEALATVLRTPVPVTGAGRTDTGVHARVMYAHFDVDGQLADTARLAVSLNRLVGRDIAVHSIFGVHPDAHARFDAVSRQYKYFVTFGKSAFLYPYSWNAPSPLDVEAMNRAARILTGTDDFTSFAKLHTDVKTNICKVTRAEWSSFDNAGDSLALPVPGIVFTIEADRFLRNMVRAVVGTLVEVGRGKMDIDGFRRVIEQKDRCKAGTSMPPQALFLWDIQYPYLDQ